LRGWDKEGADPRGGDSESDTKQGAKEGAKEKAKEKGGGT
jgi:hypothetical protein